MSFLKKLFKKKEGGTTFGNLLRAGAKMGKTAAGAYVNGFVPGAGNIVHKLPIGEGLMMKKGGQAAPLALPSPASHSLVAPATQSTKDVLKQILNGAAEGAKDGALDVYLNKTESGKQVVQDATENQINKYLPYVAGGLALYVVYKNLKSK